MKKGKSPYLESQWRLADIVAAIQAMGAYPWAQRKVEGWVCSLGDPLSAKNWLEIFEQHPEFFKSDGEWVSLRWRRAYDSSYDAKANRELNAEEIEKLTPEERRQLTRKPLTSDQIEVLLKTAIEMHSRAIAQQQEGRWWVPVWLPALSGLIGAILGALATFAGAYFQGLK